MSLSEEDRNKLWDEIEDLRCKMQTAVDQEHYEEAASMRDRIKALKMQDPYSQAEVKLEEAVSAEDYAEASRLRALMQEVGKPPLRLKRDDGARTLEGLLVEDAPSHLGADAAPRGARPSETQAWRILTVPIQ